MNKRYMDFTPVKSNRQPGATVPGQLGTRRRVMASQPIRQASSRPMVQMPNGNGTMRTRTVSRTVGRVTTSFSQGSHREVARTTMQSTAVSAGNGAPVRMVRTASQQTMLRRAQPRQQMVSSRNSMNSRRVAPNEIRLGEIEDLNAKFVMTDVPKRPLSEGSEPIAAQEYLEEPAVEKELVKTKPRKLGGRFRGMKAATKESTKKTIKTQAKGAGTGVASGKTQGTPFINQDKVAKRPLSKRASAKKTVPAKEITTDKPVTIIAKPKKDSRVGMVVAIILTIILGAVAGTVAFLLLPK